MKKIERKTMKTEGRKRNMEVEERKRRRKLRKN